MNDKIRKILKDHGRLSKEVDTSHASVNVMLALEGEFDVEFPDHMLKRSVFESIAAIRGAIEELKQA
jgi:acyl carrier protein